MSKNENKLNPCPFCGSDAEFVEVDVGQFVIRCTQCNASGDYYGTELGARAAWDDRRGYLKTLFCNKQTLFACLSIGFISYCFYAFILLFVEKIIPWFIEVF